MAVDENSEIATPARLSPSEWLDRFTDFGEYYVHPDPPFLRRISRSDPPTLQLKRAIHRRELS